ncbi:uncharacterized protein [Drosophila takahashii]|uniref:uncharacterized protein isoform X2 n=1 Tax=Drosophila takahashii TaxID=29030 RepID=UPI003898EBA4
MLKKLLSFEQFCEDHFDPNINLTCSEWEELKILVDILEPAFIATQKLQSTQLYMGDFYKLWLELKLTIGAVSHVNSNILKSCIETREEALLGNNAVVCSVYLDPRIRRVLLINPISLMLAKAQLKLLIVQILNIEQQVFPSCSDSPQPSTSSQIRVQNAQPLEESNTCSLLNEFLNTIEVASGDEDGYSEIVKAVHREIDNYNPKPVDVNMNIMEYWETKKFSYPYLFMLAKVVHAVPATKQSTWFASTRTGILPEIFIPHPPPGRTTQLTCSGGEQKGRGRGVVGPEGGGVGPEGERAKIYFDVQSLYLGTRFQKTSSALHQFTKKNR